MSLYGKQFLNLPKGPVEEEGTVPKLFRKYQNLHGDLSDPTAYNAIARDENYGPRFLSEFEDRLYFGTDMCGINMEVELDSLLICPFHSSFKSLGEVDGGADAVIRGFDDAVGKSGTVVVPTLCSEDFFNSYKNWHLDKKSDVGYLTEYFRKLPDALRSDHATHSVAARGPLARELTFEHSAYGPHLCPFGEYAFADSSPWMKMYKKNAKIVFVGVNMKYNTMKHLIEATVTEKLVFRLLITDGMAYGFIINLISCRSILIHLVLSAVQSAVMPS